MKQTALIILFFIASQGFAQKTPADRAQPIVAEGKLLYKCEMASWYGTDIFLEKYADKENIGGYFSYPLNNAAACIFFSKGAAPKIIGEIIFDSTYATAAAKLNLTERVFTAAENTLYHIRKNAQYEIMQDTSLFKTYRNTSLNLIPLINGTEKKVYVLTGPQQNGVVIFGNDYLLTFDEHNNLLTKKQLHKNIIPIYFNNKDASAEDAVHSHLPETGEFITATDICTLMLYEKFTKWKQHSVISKEYLNIWNCLTDELVVLPMDTIKKINNDEEKRKKKN